MKAQKSLKPLDKPIMIDVSENFVRVVGRLKHAQQGRILSIGYAPMRNPLATSVNTPVPNKKGTFSNETGICVNFVGQQTKICSLIIRFLLNDMESRKYTTFNYCAEPAILKNEGRVNGAM